MQTRCPCLQWLDCCPCVSVRACIRVCGWCTAGAGTRGAAAAADAAQDNPCSAVAARWASIPERERFTYPGLCHHFSQHPPWLSTQMVQHMKACGSGFQKRQISWQNSSWLLSNELLSVTLKTDMRSRKKPVTFEILASFISPSIYAQITWKYHHNKAYLMENTSAPVNGLKY